MNPNRVPLLKLHTGEEISIFCDNLRNSTKDYMRVVNDVPEEAIVELRKVVVDNALTIKQMQIAFAIVEESLKYSGKIS